ncbi:MAG: GNAT family N-acetyltransferase [Lachnospiraceae bacterium]|nr:GNAT family N-acetyltransferase [Lachnospiraceae bacterium]
MRIHKMMSENEEILFNIFFRVLESDDSFWASDEKSYIIGQTNESMPLWIWISGQADEEAYRKMESVLEERLDLNPKLRVTGDEKRVEKLLDRVAAKKNVHYNSLVPMVIYRCDKVTNPKKATGHSIYSDETHKPILERFITGMVHDLEHRPMNDGEAEGFAEAVAGSENLFLWEDEGEPVSMAMIAHRTPQYARINTVYTDNTKRGKGYAGALMGEVTQRVLDEGRIPMLYTEQDNVCSNATYRRVGYQCVGELVEYRFV